MEAAGLKDGVTVRVHKLYLPAWETMRLSLFSNWVWKPRGPSESDVEISCARSQHECPLHFNAVDSVIAHAGVSDRVHFSFGQIRGRHAACTPREIIRSYFRVFSHRVETDANVYSV